MKAFITAIAILAVLSGSAQPFVGLQLLNAGAGYQLGYLHNNTIITAAYKTPFTKNDVSKITSISIGRQLMLSKNDADNYSITPSIGVAHYRIQDFTAYESDPTGKKGIIQISEIKPIYSIEAGKDSHMGRVFISASYCGGMYYGIGLKVFMYR